MKTSEDVEINSFIELTYKYYFIVVCLLYNYLKKLHKVS